jgi:IclR family transcriptional regulator, KDG regulon repressor
MPSVPLSPTPAASTGAVAGASTAELAAESASSTVRKALAIVSAFSYGEPVLGVSELARRLGYGKSTVHRILTTLREEGFVERTPDDRYRLSLRLYEIGQQVAVSTELRELAHVALERLRNETGETAHLAVLAGADVVYLDRLESPHMLRVFTKLGRRRAAHATSSGKCLLAFGSPADVQAAIAGGLPRLGPRTAITKASLTRILTEVRSKGYATSVEESAPGVASVGAPVFDGTGSCVAAVSVAGPTARLSDENLDRAIRLVIAAAADVSRALAKRPATSRR